MQKVGHVKDIGFDADGYERRKRLDALAECPGCGKDVECWAETEGWTKGKDGRWHHSEYGGSMGICDDCELLIADCLFDGFQVFDLSKE